MMPIGQTLHGAFMSVADKFPDTLCIEQGETRLTYGAMAGEVAVLSEALREVGVGIEDAVALDLPPSPRTVAAMIACSQCGAAFLPLDQRDPATRRHSLIQSIAPAAVVSAGGVRARSGSATLASRLAPRLGLAAYVSHTSGSTGTPKAVVTEQAAIVNYIRFARRRFGLAKGDRQLQFSSIAFDIAIEEIFTTLTSGATLVMRSADFHYDGVSSLLDFCAQTRISVLNLPTGAWNQFGADLARHPSTSLPECLRLIVVGGEAASPAAVTAWYAASRHAGFRVVNTYGPTEAAVSVSMAELTPQVPITIGRPIDGAIITIRDEHLSPVRDGTPGEVVVGGVPVARGYLSAGTAGFMQLDRQWCYRTGDLGRFLPDGQIEFLGRADSQIKVRGGFRVEPGETASALLSHVGVRQAHVQPHQRRHTKVLAAFVVVDEACLAATSAPAALRDYLATRLPDYMMPAAIVVVPSIPLTVRGKIDASALDALVVAEFPTAAEGRDGVDTSSDAGLRSIIDRAWIAALGVAPDHDDDNFFEAGGDSLAAVEFIETLHESLGRTISILELYRGPTAGQLVQALQHQDVAIPTVHRVTGRSLVRLRRGGTGRLWCFLPPLSGGVVRYASMAKLLPPRDGVWALEASASLSNSGMTRLIDGMTDVVLDANLDGFSSICCSGYSLGGVFAYEFARRLAERIGSGRHVCALLLDPPDPREPPMQLVDAFDLFVAAGWKIPEPVASFITADGAFDLVGVAAAARRAGTLGANAADHEVSDSWLVYAANSRILYGYELLPASIPTLLLQCRHGASLEEAPRQRPWRIAPATGSWASVIAPAHTSIVGIEHLSLMLPPNDALVADWLSWGADVLEGRRQAHR